MEWDNKLEVTIRDLDKLIASLDNIGSLLSSAGIQEFLIAFMILGLAIGLGYSFGKGVLDVIKFFIISIFGGITNLLFRGKKK